MTVSTWTDIKTLSETNLPNNTTKQITPAKQRELWADTMDTLNDTNFAPVGDSATQTLVSTTAGNSDIETTSQADTISGPDYNCGAWIRASSNKAGVIIHSGSGLHTLEKAQVRWSPTGILCERGSTSYIYNCHIYQNQSFGIYVQSGATCTVNRCMFDQNGESINENVSATIYVEPGGKCTVRNSMIHGDGQNHFSGVGSAKNCVIFGDWIEGDSANWTFDGCTFIWMQGDSAWTEDDWFTYGDKDYAVSNNVVGMANSTSSTGSYPSGFTMVKAYRNLRWVVGVASANSYYGALKMFGTADIDANPYTAGVTYELYDVVHDAHATGTGNLYRATAGVGGSSTGNTVAGDTSGVTWTLHTRSWDNLIARYHSEEYVSGAGSATVGISASQEANQSGTRPDSFEVPPLFPGDDPWMLNPNNNQGWDPPA